MAELFLGLASEKVIDTHPQTILYADSSGAFSPYGVDVPPINDRGLLTVPTRTNKCENYNANPTDLTGVFLVSSPAEATLSLVDDADALVASGFGGLIASGKMNAKVYRLDNSLGASAAQAYISGGVGNLNPHTVTAYARGSGGRARTRLSTVTDGSAYTTLTATYQRLSVTLTPTLTTETARVQVEPGVICYFILNQLEEGPFATDPIITSGSAATRTGNRPRLEGLPDGGRAFVFDLDVLQPAPPAGLPRLFVYSDGTPTNRFEVLINSGTGGIFGSMFKNGVQAGGINYSLAGAPFPRRLTLYGAASEGYWRYGFVGGTDIAATVPPLSVGLNMLGFGGHGWLGAENSYTITRRFAEYRLNPGDDPADAFAMVKATGQEWAA